MPAIVSISPQPGHPYNAHFLHRNLLRLSMPRRDEWWSTFVHQDYWEPESPVRRLVEWAEIDGVPAALTEESVFLMGTAIAWFLTSSNRFLRDRATKALVRIFTNRLLDLRRLLESFESVDDLYVQERLAAVAYGCAMRSTDADGLGELALWCYRSFFEKTPPPHILLRDYARGVVDLTLNKGLDITIDRKRIEPPYGSKWPRSIPSAETLKPLGQWTEDSKLHVSQRAIYYSAMSGGDFDRYVIGTNSGSFDWVKLRLGKPAPPSPAASRDKLLSTLSADQHSLWNAYDEARLQYLAAPIQLFDHTEGFRFTRSSELQAVMETAWVRLTGTLDRKQRQLLEHASQTEYDSSRQRAFDLGLIQRFIFNRVLELGWTADLFGEFDKYADSHGRHFRDAHKSERIGKKYQWLAYHEVLARIADNFVFAETWSHKDLDYQGPWQVHARDIDPSLTLVKIPEHKRGSTVAPWWPPRGPTT